MDVSCDADWCVRLGVQTVTASQVQYVVKLFVIPARSRLSRSSALRSPISTTIENTQISFPLRAYPCDPVPVQQIDRIINVPVPQIPWPIVEAVKYIPHVGSAARCTADRRRVWKILERCSQAACRSLSSTVSQLESTTNH